jgi:hypothetical protein
VPNYGVSCSLNCILNEYTAKPTFHYIDCK